MNKLNFCYFEWSYQNNFNIVKISKNYFIFFWNCHLLAYVDQNVCPFYMYFEHNFVSWTLTNDCMLVEIYVSYFSKGIIFFLYNLERLSKSIPEKR